MSKKILDFTFSLCMAFKQDYIRYVDFTRIAASSTTTDDVIN